MPKTKKLRVLVFYGGDAATNQRNELLAWLRGDSVGVDARLVAEDPPHSEGAVDDRVDAAIEDADKAIALVTPDRRCEYGAPNVMDEIGRWRGARGKQTLCIVRQDGVPVYSNHAGIVFVGFKERVKEVFENIREFLLHEKSSKKPGKTTKPTTVSGKKDFVVDSNPNAALINGRRFTTSKIEEADGRLTIVADKLDGEEETALRELKTRNGRFEIAYGNTAVLANVEDVRPSHGKTVQATVVCRVIEQRSSSIYESTVSTMGGKAYSPDDLATMRAERILFNDHPASKSSGFDSIRSFIKGHGDLEIKESPIPGLLEGLPRGSRATWEAIRLALIAQLKRSGAVEHIEKLKLTVRGGRLVGIEFSGRRAKRYVNENAFQIKLDRKVNF